MSDNKKSFILYADLIKIVEQLPDEVAGKLFKIILRYVNEEEICVEDLLLKVAFEPIRQQLLRNSEKWDVIKEKRSLAGKKSAEIKKENQQTSTKSTHVESVEQTSTKSTVNDNVNVTVNGNVNVIKENTAPTQKIFDLDYFKSIGYDWNISPPIKIELDKFLSVRQKIHKDPIRAPEAIEAILRILWDTSEGNALYMLRNTIEKQAKNLIKDLPKKEENGRNEKIGRHTTDAMAKFING